MIFITRMNNGILVQRDATEVYIDAPAVPLALPTIITSLISDGKALANARRESYEAGLVRGHEQGRIEAEARHRCEEQALLEMDALTALRVVRTHQAA
jgi:hypothetical protein